MQILNRRNEICQYTLRTGKSLFLQHIYIRPASVSGDHFVSRYGVITERRRQSKQQLWELNAHVSIPQSENKLFMSKKTQLKPA